MEIVRFSVEICGRLRTMEKDEHGARLAAAMAAQRLDRTGVAKAVHRSVRTVTNWTSGKTMPTSTERATLRALLGDYDNPGDPVEVAIFGSGLTEDRQYDVIGYYKRRMREQQLETPTLLSEEPPTLRSVAKPGGLEPEEGDLNDP